MNRSTFATGTALFALLLLSAMFVFDVRTLERFSGTVGLALTYLPLPFLVLTAIAWGVRGGTLAVFTLAAVAILNTHQGDGPFAAQDVIPGESLVEVQLYVAALALMTLLMSALRASQMRALKEAADWRLRYETAITSNRNVIFELDPRNHHLIWGGDTRAIIGVDPKDLKTFDQWLAHAHAEDQTRVRLAFDAIAAGATATAALHYRAIAADGNVHHLEISATAVVDFDEQIHRISGLIREMPDPSGYNSAAQA